MELRIQVLINALTTVTLTSLSGAAQAYRGAMRYLLATLLGSLSHLLGVALLYHQFSVWAKRENFNDLKNSTHEEIKNAFDTNGIEIPFPHRTLYSGSATEPFPIKTVKSR